MGWNDIKFCADNRLFSNLESNPRFYFLHSYYFECNDANNSIATASYGNNFTCAVNRNNIYGVQFHPEKSHHNGVAILKKFAEF
jgi:glutamine amidotransferase